MNVATCVVSYWHDQKDRDRVHEENYLRVSEMSGDIKIDISKYPGETGQDQTSDSVSQINCV